MLRSSAALEGVNIQNGKAEAQSLGSMNSPLYPNLRPFAGTGKLLRATWPGAIRPAFLHSSERGNFKNGLGPLVSHCCQFRIVLRRSHSGFGGCYHALFLNHNRS